MKTRAQSQKVIPNFQTIFKFLISIFLPATSKVITRYKYKSVGEFPFLDRIPLKT